MGSPDLYASPITDSPDKDARWDYSPEAWQQRVNFVHLLGEVCAEQEVELNWFPGYWTAELSRNGQQRYVDGYVFPLNSATSEHIMEDKTATSMALERAGIPVIPHRILRTEKNAINPRIVQNFFEMPVVVKPNNGVSGGTDVMRCVDESAFYDAHKKLTEHNRTIAVSPYEEFEKEYRTIVLDGKPLVTFAKVRPIGSTEWRHNLKLGAIAELQTDPDICKRVGALAANALNAVGGRFASVDSTDTNKILEINGGVSFNYFRQGSSGHDNVARSIYGLALERSFA